MTSTTKTILYLFTVFVLAYIVYFVTATQQSFWVIWSAFIFSLLSLGNTFSRRIGSIALFVIISALAAFLSGLCAHSMIGGALFLLILTGASIFFIEMNPEYSLQAFIIPLFGILGSSIASSFSMHLAKLLFIITGGAIVIAAQFIFVYKFRINETQYWISIAVDHLKTFSNEIFAAFQPAYKDNTYLFERRMHMQKIKFMHAMKKIREFESDLATSSTLTRDNTLSLENLYAALLDCSQLRNRISDPTIFSLCTQEMNALLANINELFAKLLLSIRQQTKIEFSTEPFIENIRRFDELYHNVLKVTSREPTVFVLFIESIKKIEQEMQMFYSGLK